MKRVVSLILLFIGLIYFGSRVFGAKGDVSIDPSVINTNPNEKFSVRIKVDTGGSKIGAYQFTISFDPSVIQMDTPRGDKGVEAGSGFPPQVINTEKAKEGRVVINSFDPSGKGPSSALEIAIIHFIALGSSGSATAIDIKVDDLTDEQVNPITAKEIGGSVNIGIPPPPPTTAIPPGAPTVDLDSPKTNLRTGDSFILDLVLKSGGSKSPIDFFFNIEIGGLFTTTIYLGPNLEFMPNRIPVVTNLTPIDAKVRMFGPAPSIFVPSIFREFIIPPEVMGSFIFGAEVVDSSTKASISRDSLSITVNVQ